MLRYMTPIAISAVSEAYIKWTIKLMLGRLKLNSRDGSGYMVLRSVCHSRGTWSYGKAGDENDFCYVT